MGACLQFRASRYSETQREINYLQKLSGNSLIRLLFKIRYSILLLNLDCSLLFEWRPLWICSLLRHGPMVPLSSSVLLFSESFPNVMLDMELLERSISFKCRQFVINHSGKALKLAFLQMKWNILNMRIEYLEILSFLWSFKSHCVP